LRAGEADSPGLEGRSREEFCDFVGEEGRLRARRRVRAWKKGRAGGLPFLAFGNANTVTDTEHERTFIHNRRTRTLKCPLSTYSSKDSSELGAYIRDFQNRSHSALSRI
jgi:hypothetical protein